ncbi:MAG: FKBP-type peptidyl-prolyl cis-trans isomerase [Bacteroidota bacterium]
MNPLLFVVRLLFISIIFVSCNSGNKTNDENKSELNNAKSQKESLIKVNKYLVAAESVEIENYIRRHNLNMIETGSGVKYQITKTGTGEKATKGRIVVLNYKVKLITGDVIYSSAENGTKQFKIGYGGVESGLEEAILFMRGGDEAIIIIPSHLAFGLLGDNKKVPSRSTVIYEIEITNIN